MTPPLNVDQLLPVLVVVVPAAVATLKRMAPRLPSRLVPWVALGLGFLGEVTLQLAAGQGLEAPGVSGALAGLTGIGLRELVDQTTKGGGPEE